MDIDDNASHVEGSTTVVMSAGETESESENEPIDQPDECQETAYIQQYEEEFGAVSCLLFLLIKLALINSVILFYF